MSVSQNEARSIGFKSPENGAKALSIASWLSDRGYASAIRETDDGVITVTYCNDTGKIWPAIRINDTVIWPAGSPFDLMMEFLESE
jgi:hypothetical protein